MTGQRKPVEHMTRIEHRLIGVCKRCLDHGEGGAWVSSDDIGRDCFQCAEDPDLDYIPRYRKRRAWVVVVTGGYNAGEYAFFGRSEAIECEAWMSEEEAWARRA